MTTFPTQLFIDGLWQDSHDRGGGSRRLGAEGLDEYQNIRFYNVSRRATS